ncbi:hypothetical protein VNO77_27487 [Canavalia gladiata]|uniref:Uncharacterized protein n=1 Tax=Canavalia gladiata TaxID=3824 RepID=A0AAN9KXD5_CANGL
MLFSPHYYISILTLLVFFLGSYTKSPHLAIAKDHFRSNSLPTVVLHHHLNLSISLCIVATQSSLLRIFHGDRRACQNLLSLSSLPQIAMTHPSPLRKRHLPFILPLLSTRTIPPRPLRRPPLYGRSPSPLFH